MLNSASMTRDDYDQTLLGGLTSPVKGLQMTRPVVIIDEPHRFARDNKFYRAIQAIQPQMIVRFGATFPDIVEGKGKINVYVKITIAGNRSLISTRWTVLTMVW